MLTSIVLSSKPGVLQIHFTNSTDELFHPLKEKSIIVFPIRKWWFHEINDAYILLWTFTVGSKRCTGRDAAIILACFPPFTSSFLDRIYLRYNGTHILSF